MKKFLCAIVLMLTFMSLIAAGGEAPSAVPAASAAVAEKVTVIPEWMQYALTGLGTIIAGGITWFFNHLRAKSADSDAKRDAVDALEAGIQKAYDDIVRDLKEKSADGKLTAEEKMKARQYAIDQAKAVATDAGKQALSGWGKDLVIAMVEKILAKRKAGKTV